jgi:hypothetical protein
MIALTVQDEGGARAAAKGRSTTFYTSQLETHSPLGIAR